MRRHQTNWLASGCPLISSLNEVCTYKKWLATMILTKKRLRGDLKKLEKVKPDLLWRAVHDLGALLALHGQVGLAVDIWRLLYSMNVQPKLVTCHGDSAIASVCLFSGLPDLSCGLPAPSSLEGKTGLGLSERVDMQHAWAVHRSLTERYTSLQELESHNPMRVFHDGLSHARAGRKQEAIDLLQDSILNSPGKRPPVSYSQGAEVLLVIHSMATELGDAARAKWALESWYELVEEYPLNTSFQDAFHIKSVARALCSGFFTNQAEDLGDELKGLIPAVSEQIERCLERGKKPAPKKHKIYVSYNQFSLEPRLAAEEWIPFQDPEESRQGFSLFPGHAAIATPGETAYCDVTLKFARSQPDLSDCVQAVCVPLEVKERRIYLREVLSADDTMPFDVEPGNYEVFVRFFAHGKPGESGHRNWQVDLTFMPSGTIGGARTFKLEHP